MSGKIMKERCSHSAASLDTKLFIFGGYGQDGYSGSALLTIELNAGSEK
jgi:hypothetical protein